MLAISIIGALNAWMILLPPRPLAVLLELMSIPLAARVTLSIAVVVNILISVGFESWGTVIFAELFGLVAELVEGMKRRNSGSRGGMGYKPLPVEGGPRDR